MLAGAGGLQRLQLLMCFSSECLSEGLFCSLSQHACVPQHQYHRHARMHAHTHTHTRTHTHTHRHTCTHTKAYVHTRIYTHKHVRMQAYTYLRTHMHKHTHACAHVRTGMHTRGHIPTCSLTTDTQTHTCCLYASHLCVHTVHTYIHIHRHTHTHMHVHRHTVRPRHTVLIGNHAPTCMHTVTCPHAQTHTHSYKHAAAIWCSQPITQAVKSKIRPWLEFDSFLVLQILINQSVTYMLLRCINTYLQMIGKCFGGNPVCFQILVLVTIGTN